MGEGWDEADTELVHLVTSASIACGGHAGDPQAMARTIRKCLDQGIRTGAHPSYSDRANFGRVSIKSEPRAVADAIIGQVTELMQIAKGLGARIGYLKPHGALYNDAARGEAMARALVAASKELGLPIMGLADSPFEDMVRGASIGFIREGFADRRYLPTGALVPRSHPGAIIRDPEEAASQAITLASRVDSICIHSDTPGAVKIAASVRKRLIEDGWQIGN